MPLAITSGQVMDSPTPDGDGESDSSEISQFRQHLEVSLNRQPMKATLDSGNTWHSCMSDHVWYLLGYTLDDLDTSQAAKVSTAKEGADLDVLGQPPWDLTLKVPRTSFAVKIRPKVVRGLTMALNLSGPWMKQNRWDQLHSQDAVSIQGNLVPLCKDDQDEWPAAAIHGPSEDEIIPAGHIRILSLSAPLLRETPALHGWGVGTLDPKSYPGWVSRKAQESSIFLVRMAGCESPS